MDQTDVGSQTEVGPETEVGPQTEAGFEGAWGQFRSILSWRDSFGPFRPWDHFWVHSGFDVTFGKFGFEVHFGSILSLGSLCAHFQSLWVQTGSTWYYLL